LRQLHRLGADDKLLDVKEELDKLCALQFKGVYFFLQAWSHRWRPGAAARS
jgi:hypothetical protein